MNQEKVISLIRFNSLQTGKCVASGIDKVDTEFLKGSFNSLQTGKCVARHDRRRRQGKVDQ